jgi:hypothetical protein
VDIEIAGGVNEVVAEADRGDVNPAVDEGVVGDDDDIDVDDAADDDDDVSGSGDVIALVFSGDRFLFN